MSTHLTSSQLSELQTALLQRKAEIEQRMQQVRDGQSRAEQDRKSTV